MSQVLQKEITTTNNTIVFDVAPEPTANPIVVAEDIPLVEPKPTTLGLSDKQIDQFGDKYAKTMLTTNRDILSSVKTSAAGELGGQLNTLVSTAKKLNPERMQRKGIIGAIQNVFSDGKAKMFAEYASVETQMNELIKEINKSVDLQKKRIVDLEQMFKDNEVAYSGLRQDETEAQRILDIMNVELEELENWAAKQTNLDVFKAQQINDFRARRNRLEKKIDDIKRIIVLTELAAPQIRMMQDAARALTTKFVDIQTMTIPAWQQNFAMYIIQEEQRHAAKLAKETTDMTNEAIKKSSEMIGKTSVEIARLNQQAIVEVETLVTVHQNLVNSETEVKNIQREGRQARAQALPQIEALEKELVSTFIGKI